MKKLELSIPYELTAMRAAAAMLSTIATALDADALSVHEVEAAIKEVVDSAEPQEPARACEEFALSENEEQTATLAPPTNAVSVFEQVDEKGVAFNAEFCGKAKEPFNKTGPRKGQWKKRIGVEQADYDAWYASQVQAEPAEQQPVNAASAFGSAQKPAQETPKNMGELSVWLSRMQAAGRLTYEQVKGAYTAAGVQINDMFPPVPADKIALNVAAVYSQLEPLTHE